MYLSSVDALKVVLNEGMPQLKNPFEKGRLIIQFHVSKIFFSSVQK